MDNGSGVVFEAQNSSGSQTLVDINYIKVFKQAIDPILDVNYSMGLTDFVDLNVSTTEKQSKDEKKNDQGDSKNSSLYMVSLFKPELGDIMSIHRGFLGLVKLFRDQNSPSKLINKYEAQILGQGESKCEYFQVVKLEDGKNWFIISLHEDGSLLINVPEKISKSSL